MKMIMKMMLMLGVANLLTLMCPIRTGDLVFHHFSDRMCQEKMTVEEHQVQTVAEPMIDDTNKDITVEDIELLASLIYYEQGEPETTEDEERCYLTGCVVLNRIASPEFPDTLEGVIYQTGQYACINKIRNGGYYGDICFEIAEGLLTYGVENVPENLVFQAQFRQGSGVYKNIYNQYFCYR